MRLLLWTALILWVGDASGQTTTTTSYEDPAVATLKSELHLDGALLDYLVGLPQNAAQSTTVEYEVAIIASEADANFSSFLYPELPASEYKFIETVGLAGAELKYGSSLTGQPWYTRLLDEINDYNKDLITLLENVESVSATVGYQTTTEVQTYRRTNLSTPVVVTSTTTATGIVVDLLGPTPSISLTATETVLVTATVNGVQVVYPQATSLGFTITAPPSVHNSSQNATQSLISSTSAPNTLSHTSSIPTPEPPANSSGRAERIGLGLGLSLLLLIGVISFILRLRRHRKKRRLSADVESSGLSGGRMMEKSELDANGTKPEIRRQSQISEAGRTTRHELSGETQPQEVDGTTHTHESDQPLQPLSENETGRYELDGADDSHKIGEGDISQSEEGNVSALSE